MAKEKGVTPEKLRTIIIDEHSKKIDEEVSKGMLTKEKAVTFKDNLKVKMQNWDGTLKNPQHFNPIYSILKDKLGLTDAQLDSAKESKKTAFDLANVKGINAAQLKSMIIDDQSKRIDEAVTKGMLTKEKAITVKEKLKTKIENWDGSLEHKNKK